MNKTATKPLILIVDDEPAILEIFQTILEEKFETVTAQNGSSALDAVRKAQVSLVFLDIKLPDMDGLEVLRRIKEYDSDLSVIVATAVDSVRMAVEAMHSGACDYITKPFDVDEVMAVAEKALEREKLLKEVAYFRSQEKKIRFDNIIGKSTKMQEVFGLLEKVFKNDTTIYISGESGTGKELIAKAIHYHSERREKPFIPINCAAIPENLLESELFGHEKGAFTDAGKQKPGLFELANEGTLFLDEISTLRLDMQAKLLRVLEEREVKRVGGSRIIKIDVRIISATNTDLREAVRKGDFRADLYYRLNIVPITLPPLREREEDIPLLAEYFFKHYNQKFRKKIKGISLPALQSLQDYEWPGNVRELKNIIERIVALKDDGVIREKDLPFEVFLKNKLSLRVPFQGGLKEASNDFERKYIKAILEKAEGNQVKAAQILGLHRNRLAIKMKKLGLK